MNKVAYHLKKIPVCYKLPRYLVEWLRKQDIPASQIIEGAICKEYALQPTKENQIVRCVYSHDSMLAALTLTERNLLLLAAKHSDEAPMSPWLNIVRAAISGGGK